MNGIKRRLDRLELAKAEHKQRLVLYHEPQSQLYGCVGHSYTEDELEGLREQYDLMVIVFEESHNWLGEHEGT